MINRDMSSMSKSQSSNKLPSLSRSFHVSMDLSASEFATSLPVVSRSFGDVFGASMHSFSRSDLRTPPEERDKILQARRLKQTAVRSRTVNQVEASMQKSNHIALSSPPKLGPPSRQSSMQGLDVAKQKIKQLENIGNFDREKYVGEKAKSDLYALYKQSNRDLSVYVKEEDIPEGRRTPRSLYLREVERRNLPPLTLILRKPDDSHGVFLANRGLGDEHVAPLVEIIHTLPNVTTVDLNDNRLTDVTLMPLMIKLVSMATLTHLDLSYNKIDDSSEVIMTYIASNACTLNTLMLNGADVDDTEAGNLAQAISHNTSISTLCLSHNLLGKDELAAATNADVVTGGVAIGLMLEVNATLTRLDLSWNAIRLASADKLATSLRKNTTLRELKLGHNGFGDSATQILGRGLKTNAAMESIDLSYNSLNPRSIAVLANSLVFNETMTLVNLDGNILGRVGTQAMVSAIQRANGRSLRKLQISFSDCDCRKDEKGLFDPSNPSGEYELDLSTAYGVMVMDECFYLGNYRAGVTLSGLEYNAGVGYGFQSIKLVQEASKANNGKFNPDEFRKNSKTLAGLIMESSENNHSKSVEAADALCKLLRTFNFNMMRKAALPIIEAVKSQWELKEANNKALKTESTDQLYEVLLFEIFFALFVTNDDDCSGTIDADEFVSTLDALGVPITKDTAVRLMGEFDKDKSGCIDASEFSAVLVNEYCRTEAPRGQVVEASTGRPWVIPATGKVRIKVDCVCDAPSLFDVGDDSGVESIIRAMKEAKTDEQKELIFEQAVQSPYHFMTDLQGQMLLDELAGPSDKRNAKSKQFYTIIGNILPQLVSAEFCVKFIHQNLDDHGALCLRLLMGNMFNALTGSPTGHYSFDLKKPAQFLLARKLAAIANTETKFCKSLGCNTGQHGDYSHFRNEQFDGNNSRISTQWIATCQPTGKLGLDFVSTTRPKQGKQGLSSTRFEKFMLKLDLQAISHRQNDIDIAEMKDEKTRQELEAARVRLLALENSNNTDVVSGMEVVPTLRKKTTGLLSKTSSIVSMKSKLNSVRTLTAINTAAATQPASVASLSPMNSISNLSLYVDDLDIPSGTLSVRSSMHPSTTGVSRYSPIPGSAAISRSGSGRGSPGMSMLGMNGNSHGAWANPVTMRGEVEVLIAEDISEPISMAVVKEYYSEFIESSHMYLDVYPVERARDNTSEVLETPREFRMADKPDRYNFPPIYPFALRKLLMLQVQLLGVTLSAEQAACIVQSFPSVAFLRVHVFLHVFGCIVDFDNLSLIIDGVLNDLERMEAVHRIGCLNLFDSMYPNRRYRLDLRRWDHREWAKVLIHLAMIEPGDNWKDPDYRWSRFDISVAGWELPQTWTLPDDGGSSGPRTFGWLQTTYTTSGHGCVPNFNARRLQRKKLLAGLKPLF